MTDYGLGARGIDAMYVTQSGTTTASYPICDAHGNMISTLTKQGTGGYQFSALRTFDAWGNIRLGTQTGDPKGRYCANLGHKQDDESGLVYMRARYYEPTSGRFISADPKMQGGNWFQYCYNNPISYSDRNGCEGEADFLLAIIGAYAALSGFIPALGIDRLLATTSGKVILLAGLTMTATWFLTQDPNESYGTLTDKSLAFAIVLGGGSVAGCILTALSGMAVCPPNMIAQEAVGAVTAYCISVAFFMACEAMEEATNTTVGSWMN